MLEHDFADGIRQFPFRYDTLPVELYSLQLGTGKKERKEIIRKGKERKGEEMKGKTERKKVTNKAYFE